MNDVTTAQPSDKTNNYLANERTFLAWIRTSISIIVFGFVVSRFGIMMHGFFNAHSSINIKESRTSMLIGMGFMVFGIVTTLIATIRYRLMLNSIEAEDFKPNTFIAALMGFFTALFGVVLIIYLMGTAQNL